MQALSQLSYTPSRRQPNYVLAFRPGMQISLQPVKLAEWTGLEPATPGVTGRYSNQLNYHSAKPFTHTKTGEAPALLPQD